MATRFQEQATQQLSPVYQQQETAIQSQLPAIQNLYKTLIEGLQGQYNQNLQTGTQEIVEDASARGVLRSTLPVDARQALTASLGQALMAGRAQLGSQQAQDVAGINEKLGGLRVQKAGAIADLARSLESQDLEAQKFAYQQRLDAQQLALARQKAASSGGRTITAAQNTQLAVSALAKELRSVAGRDGYVSPQDYAAGRREWVAAGFSSKTYDDYFSGYKNPQNQNYKYF